MAGENDSAAIPTAPAIDQKRLRVDLTGQVAVVTGASQGLGRAIAETLAANGAAVAIVARSADKLAAVAAAIRSAGGKAEEFICDVSKAADVTAVVEAIHAKLGRLDILVNNAGVTRDTLLPRMSDEEWDEVLCPDRQPRPVKLCGFKSGACGLDPYRGQGARRSQDHLQCRSPRLHRKRHDASARPCPARRGEKACAGQKAWRGMGNR